jgi:uncharacterized membrane protein
MIDAMNISRHVISKNFWSIAGFYIVQFGLLMLGLIFFGIGVLAALPIVCYMTSFAFRDIFGFSDLRVPETSVVCC